ncbi:MAG TPA: TonB family protein, partial [Bacteroidales bacterium]|nr:TonB family protein [Bacteroidales bacterium]
MKILNRFHSVSFGVLALLVFLMASRPAAGQEIFRFNFNDQGKIVPQEYAQYYRLAPFDLGNFRFHGEVRDFYLNDTLRMLGTYDNGRKHGQFTFFFPNGLTESRGSYVNDRRTGRWEFFYDNGQLKQVAYILNVIGRRLQFIITEFYSKEGEPIIQHGTGQWELVANIRSLNDPTSLKRLKGEFRDSLKHGEFRLYRVSDNRLLVTERFNRGSFINAKFHESPVPGGFGTFEFLDKLPDLHIERLANLEQLKLDTIFFSSNLSRADPVAFFKAVTGREVSIMERVADYRYGTHALFRFIMENIRYPLEARERGITGRVFVTVQIDAQGNTTGISVQRGVHESLDNEAVRVVSLIDSWLPALRDGVPVESEITVPITFL